jgi:hypothetical protein
MACIIKDRRFFIRNVEDFCHYFYHGRRPECARK